MTETKADLEARVADLEAERDQLHGQLAAATAATPGPVQAAPRRPFLSEAERAELELRGQTTSPFTGEPLTRDQVLEELAQSDDQQGVEIAEPSPGLVAELPKTRERKPIEGVDYIWPSVAPGVLAADARTGVVAAGATGPLVEG